MRHATNPTTEPGQSALKNGIGTRIRKHSRSRPHLSAAFGCIAAAVVSFALFHALFSMALLQYLDTSSKLIDTRHQSDHLIQDPKLGIVAEQSTNHLGPLHHYGSEDIVSPLRGNRTATSVRLWHNRFDLVHILKTRFMQYQPHLFHLGKARLEIFKTFTLPSVLAQSTQEFLWIIYTDPYLHSELLSELVSLIQGHDNILLIGSNSSSFQFFREESFNGTVFWGNGKIWDDYQQASQSHILISSRLDADDSIYEDFMNQLQIKTNKTLGGSLARRQLDPTAQGEQDEKEFRVFCSQHSMEWGYFSPSRITEKEKLRKGYLVGDEQRHMCLSAGLSFAFQVGTGADGVVIAHQRIYQTFHKCDRKKHPGNCVDFVHEGKAGYATLRSRTPTSNGMKGVLISDEKDVEVLQNMWHWRHKQAYAWDIVGNFFHVDPRLVWELRATLTDDMENIVKDALQGQCSGREFSCKDSSKERLARLLKEIKHQSAAS